jgi:hypothetical protein
VAGPFMPDGLVRQARCEVHITSGLGWRRGRPAPRVAGISVQHPGKRGEKP